MIGGFKKYEAKSRYPQVPLRPLPVMSSLFALLHSKASVLASKETEWDQQSAKKVPEKYEKDIVRHQELLVCRHQKLTSAIPRYRRK